MVHSGKAMNLSSVHSGCMMRLINRSAKFKKRFVDAWDASVRRIVKCAI